MWASLKNTAIWNDVVLTYLLSQKNICKKFTYLLRRTVESIKNNHLWQVYSERTPPPPPCHNIFGYVHTIQNSFSRRHEKLFGVVWTPVRYVTLFWDRCSAVQCRAVQLCSVTKIAPKSDCFYVWTDLRHGVVFVPTQKLSYRVWTQPWQFRKKLEVFFSAMSHTRGRLSDFS